MSHKSYKNPGPFRLTLIIVAYLIFQAHAFELYSSGIQSDTIIIGFLVAENEHRAAEYGALLAIKEANNRAPTPRYYKLVSRKMEGPWGTGSKEAVDLVFREKAIAIVTSLDGRNDHLAEQVSAKTHVPIISAWSGDPTLGQAFVPWYFSCVPDNSHQMAFLVDEIFNKRKITNVAVVADNSYDSRSALINFRKISAFKGKPEPLVIYLDQTSPSFGQIAEEISNSGIECVVILAKAAHLSELARILNHIDNKPVIYASIFSFEETELPSKTPEDMDGVLMISPGFTFSSKGHAFINEFTRKFGFKPGAIAAYAYDGVSLLVDAIEKTGNNKSILPDKISQTSFNGITGTIKFDKNGNRTGELYLMKVNGSKPELLEKID